MPDLDLAPPPRFRAILGPQDDHFAAREIAAFFDSEYLVSPGADRMGMRLDGYRLDHARHTTFVSDGIAPGSIQVPGNGQPIVLLVDRQTTGGYPKIATVISADMPALGRVPIGAKIAFEPVSMETAQELRRRFVAEIEGIGERIVPIKRSAGACGAQAVRLQPDQRGGRRARLDVGSAAAGCQRLRQSQADASPRWAILPATAQRRAASRGPRPSRRTTCRAAFSA